LLASFTAYLIGEFLNAVLARLKVRTGGRFLWLRTITPHCSVRPPTLLYSSQLLLGDYPTERHVSGDLSQWLFKVIFEIIATPLTYLIVNRLSALKTKIISIGTQTSIGATLVEKERA
jgi:uncharacterized PurR-regulated membrane protein YhhQ (DUF165 family)